MSLETPNRVAAYLRFNVPDITAAPNVIEIKSVANILEIVPFDPDAVGAGGFNVSFVNKISAEAGMWSIQGRVAAPTGPVFGPLGANVAIDPFFEVAAGDWTTNGDAGVAADVNDLLTIAIIWHEGPLAN